MAVRQVVMFAALGHFQTFLSVMAAAHGLALVIVNLTKTPKDDEVVAGIYRVVELLAGIVTPRVKQ